MGMTADKLKTASTTGSSYAEVTFDGYVKLPGFCDVHVHLREPGFSYKETILSGSAACAHGGYTAVCTMPNLNPVPDNAEHLKVQTDIIARDSLIHIYPYGAITVGEQGEQIADLEGMAADVIAFSDDGKGVQDEEMMREAMIRARALGKMIVAHCEDNSLLHGGYIHDGVYARAHRHKGICSESEWGPIARDVRLVAETGCAYHVCHVSCKESVEIIRKARAEGVNVSCETAPHYLVMDENDLQEDGWFKMNPPLRSREDREALIEGIQDGTIEIIATDHAPHSLEEKAKGLAGSAFGIVGIETAFPLLYTKLVREGIISMDKLIELIAINPRKRFGIPDGFSANTADIHTFMEKNYTVWDLDTEVTVDPEQFLSMGRAMPFAGWKLYGKCIRTVCDGQVVYNTKQETI